MVGEELLLLLREHGVTEAEVRAWLRVRAATTSFRPASAAASSTVTIDDIDGLGEGLSLELDSLVRDALEHQGVGDADVPEGYDNLGVIGHGATSVIHRIGDRALKRSMAAKILRPELMLNPEAWSRFIEEAQITAQLQHPGIVPVHELGRLPDGRHYFTMKEIHGRTLGLVIREVHDALRGPDVSNDVDRWTFRRLVGAFQKACDAVAYAHERSVVHRDLKPQNIMVGSHGEVLVVDWGLARVLNETTPLRSPDDSVVTDRAERGEEPALAGQVAGTPAYMSPEQAEGSLEDIDARSDVYGLGAILYHILCGSPPYSGDSAKEVISKVRAGAPLPVEQAHAEAFSQLGAGPSSLPSVPTRLLEICHRAMSRQRERRYANAGEFSSAILAWLDGAERREMALTLVDKAHALLPDVTVIRHQSQHLLQKSKHMLDSVDPWADESVKAPAWDLVEKSQELSRKASLRSLEVEQSLLGALAYDPNLVEAHEALAKHYRALHQTYERRGHAQSTHRLEALLRTHSEALPMSHPKRSDHAVYLRGMGCLDLSTNPPGAKVDLYRYEEQHLRMVPVRVGSLGRTPIENLPLAMGSYLLVIEAEGYETVRYPVHIDRLHHWNGARPGMSDGLPIWLPPKGTLLAGEQYVPAGWFWSGGDPDAIEALPRRRLWLDGFVMSRMPVTNRFYLEFLNDLVASGREELAFAHVPTERAQAGENRGALVYSRNDEGFYSVSTDVDGDEWRLNDPVVQVDEEDAAAFVRWLSERRGLKVRLPNELEWEKAARGVDGRFFPWGNHFDASWCCVLKSHQGRPRPEDIERFPIDCSPYGVRGMGGNVRDWCGGEFHPNGPHRSADSDLVIVDSDLMEAPLARNGVQRGGAWLTRQSSARSASRFMGIPGVRQSSTGFRYCVLLDALMLKNS